MYYSFLRTYYFSTITNVARTCLNVTFIFSVPAVLVTLLSLARVLPPMVKGPLCETGQSPRLQPRLRMCAVTHPLYHLLPWGETGIFSARHLLT